LHGNFLKGNIVLGRANLEWKTPLILDTKFLVAWSGDLSIFSLSFDFIPSSSDSSSPCLWILKKDKTYGCTTYRTHIYHIQISREIYCVDFVHFWSLWLVRNMTHGVASKSIHTHQVDWALISFSERRFARFRCKEILWISNMQFTRVGIYLRTAKRYLTSGSERVKCILLLSPSRLVDHNLTDWPKM
jgi:hypothetical protein